MTASVPPPSDQVPSPADATAVVHQSIPFLQRMGLEVLAIERGYVKLRVPADINGNHVGTMYAGALFSIAEVPGGLLGLLMFDPTRFFPVIKAMSVEYLRPATSAVTVEARINDAEADRILAEAESQGKSDFVLDLEVTDADGVVVMRSSGTYQLRARQP
ncbi:MAG: YiiD C-terminal domain-containing protein [Candidatus Nanopelagicales bacterium]